MRNRSLASSAAFVGAVVLVASAAHAYELPKEACEGLKADLARMVAAGVPATMERGPDWARRHLNQTQLAEIRRYIEVGEQIAFRCERLRPIEVKQEDGPAQAEPPDAATVKPPAAAKPRPPARSAAPTAAGESKPAIERKPTARPKPKAEDAYVPPKAAPVATTPQ